MKRILVIDDDGITLTIIQTMLSNAGYSSDTAQDGKEALSRFQHEPYDLVITDIIMPQKEGIELIMELRKSGNPDLKIIAISGGGRIQSNEYLSMALKLGADTALTKPIVNEELIEKVEQFIGPS